MLLALKYHSILLSFSPITFPHRSLVLQLIPNIFLASFFLSVPYVILSTSFKTLQNCFPFIYLDFSASSSLSNPSFSSLLTTSSYHALLPFYTLGSCNQFCLPNPIPTQPIAFCCHQSTTPNDHSN